ncbi:transketolase [Pyruvatibacter sp.]|uniref:transketolase n=1 Tax=Pyruvatibacter sp. TaxID=1981328 RepID=UPI00326448C5
MTPANSAAVSTDADTQASNANSPEHNMMANAIRALAMDAVEQAKSGHPGMPMGMADVATVLFTKFMKFCAQDPSWPDRDRFVLSAGHGSMLQYSLLHLLGFEDMTIDQIKNFRQMGSLTPGHPEVDHTPGVEMTTGPLGQGISTSVGMALAERMLNARFGDDLVDHFTYVIASDGDLMEGISHEAISMAGHLKLSRLIVLFDDNGITIDGSLDLSESGDQIARFDAAGWDTIRIDGHDAAAIEAAIEHARTSDKPSLIACRTKIGFGAPTKEGTAGSHGAPLGADEIEGTRAALGWSSAPFEIPANVRDSWRVAGLRAAKDRAAWQARMDEAPDDVQAEFERTQAGSLPNALHSEVNKMKRSFTDEKKAVATRKASEAVLNGLAEVVPELVGGSADLTGSNNTRAKSQTSVTADDYSGNYIHYGIREHGMAAAMNGMALHKGLIPYGGTFLVFADYCRPSIRLAALMKRRAIYVFSHDSIGLGEDGPTHQPVEHLAALRAIPNLNVFRPADAVETAEAWEVALKSIDRPSAIALTRQNLETLRTKHTDENLSARGGYEISPSDGDAKATLIATGSEVEIAMAAQKQLQAEGVPTRVVSMPCQDLFNEQPAAYREDILRPGTVRIAVEAGIEMGWQAYIGDKGGFVGMDGFGASAPYKELYEHFGITADAVAQAVRERL